MALQQELGLPVRPDVPMLAQIGRLDPQKSLRWFALLLVGVAVYTAAKAIVVRIEVADLADGGAGQALHSGQPGRCLRVGEAASPRGHGGEWQEKAASPLVAGL